MPNPQDINDYDFEAMDVEVPDVDTEVADEPESRAERRSARAAERERERKELEERLRASEERYARLEGQMAGLAQAIRTPQGPTKSEEDAIASELRDLYRAREQATDAFMRAAEMKADRQELDRLREDIRVAEQRQIDAQIRHGIQRSQSERQVSPEQQRVEEERRRNEALYPDIMHNPHARAHVQSLILQDSKGDANYRLTEDKVRGFVERTRRDLKLGQYGQPTDQMVRSSEGFEVSAGSGGGKETKTFSMTKYDAQMANSLFRHLPEEKDRIAAYIKMQTS